MPLSKFTAPNLSSTDVFNAMWSSDSAYGAVMANTLPSNTTAKPPKPFMGIWVLFDLMNPSFILISQGDKHGWLHTSDA